MQETQVQSLGQEDSLEKRMATHSSITAWRIPWTGEPGELTVHGVTKSHTWLTFTTTTDIGIDVNRSAVSDSFWPRGLQPTTLLCPWNSPGKTGVGSHSLLQGIFLTQGANLGLLHWRQIPYCLIRQGNLYSNIASSANCKTVSELCFNSWLYNSTEKITFITLKLYFIFGPTLKIASVPQFSP